MRVLPRCRLDEAMEVAETIAAIAGPSGRERIAAAAAFARRASRDGTRRQRSCRFEPSRKPSTTSRRSASDKTSRAPPRAQLRDSRRLPEIAVDTALAGSKRARSSGRQPGSGHRSRAHALAGSERPCRPAGGRAAHSAGDRGTTAPRRRLDERRNRSASLHQPQDSRAPCEPDLCQARYDQALRGCRVRGATPRGRIGSSPLLPVRSRRDARDKRQGGCHVRAKQGSSPPVLRPGCERARFGRGRGILRR